MCRSALPQHLGSSGAMLQALMAGRPVLVPDQGLMAWRVRNFGLGLTYVPGDRRDMRYKFSCCRARPQRSSPIGSDASGVFRKSSIRGGHGLRIRSYSDFTPRFRLPWGEATHRVRKTTRNGRSAQLVDQALVRNFRMPSAKVTWARTRSAPGRGRCWRRSASRRRPSRAEDADPAAARGLLDGGDQVEAGIGRAAADVEDRAAGLGASAASSVASTTLTRR